MKRLSLFAPAVMLMLLAGCATPDKMGTEMDTMDDDMQMEKTMDKDMGHMDDGGMKGMDGMGMDEDDKMMDDSHDMDGM